MELTTRPRFNVLFLCRGDGARAALAQAALNYEGAGRFSAFAASVGGPSQVHPQALRLLAGLGLHAPRDVLPSWRTFARADAAPLDFVFCLLDPDRGETPSGLPGHTLAACWPVVDPAVCAGNLAERGLAFAQAYRVIQRRVELLASLPEEGLRALEAGSRYLPP